MTLKIARIALAIVLAGLAVEADAATKVFLLGGQSNMVGIGEVAQLAPPYNAPQSNVKFWNNASGGWVNLQGGFGANSTYFGPEVSFGSTAPTRFFPPITSTWSSTPSAAQAWPPIGIRTGAGALQRL